MTIDAQDTQPLPVLPRLPGVKIDYQWLKAFSDRSGIRMLHLYRIALGLQVSDVSRVTRPLVVPRTRQ